MSQKDGKDNGSFIKNINRKQILIIFMSIIIIILLIEIFRYDRNLGIIRPNALRVYRTPECEGLEKLYHKDHLFGYFKPPSDGRTTRPNNWNFLFDDPENDHENFFLVRIQNGAGQAITILDVDVEAPEGIHVKWSERGYDCNIYNQESNNSSGCSEEELWEAGVSSIKIEDVMAGKRKMDFGQSYRIKTVFTFRGEDNQQYTECAILHGKVE